VETNQVDLSAHGNDDLFRTVIAAAAAAAAGLPLA
jgi:hypothetical protein